LSSFIEEAIMNALGTITLRGEDASQIHPIKGADELWDVFEPDRFVKLALHHPELLTHHEQILWKLIKENELLWKTRWNALADEQILDIQESGLNWKRLREHWETFNKVARGELPTTALPEQLPDERF
jgi:hypothetical protein